MLEDNEPGAISVVGTVNATYSFDPLRVQTALVEILKNADLVKVSIEDTGRDKRTPVLLGVGDAGRTLTAIQFAEITKLSRTSTETLSHTSPTIQMTPTTFRSPKHP